METNAMTWTEHGPSTHVRLRAAASPLAVHPMGDTQLERTPTTSGRFAVTTAGGYGAFQGTGVSSVAPAAAQLGVKATVMLPIRDAVVVSGFAGLRTWGPPV